MVERESNASTSCSQPPALGGDTYQLLEVSFTFTHKHWFSSCPRTVTAKVVHTVSESTLHLTHRPTLQPCALLRAMYPEKHPIFPDLFVWKPAAGRAELDPRKSCLLNPLHSDPSPACSKLCHVRKEQRNVTFTLIRVSNKANLLKPCVSFPTRLPLAKLQSPLKLPTFHVTSQKKNRLTPKLTEGLPDLEGGRDPIPR